MSHLLDRLQFFKKKQGEFADGHGETSNESRAWEGAYRQRWQHDKIVRSTHGVNCTGSCSWKIYVKNGLITWETQQTDYPRTRPDLPNHEPRGCRAGQLFLVHLQRQPPEVPEGAQAVAQALARGAGAARRPGERLGQHRRGRRQGEELQEPARPGRLRPFQLGRGHRDHRRGQRLHRQDLRSDRVIGFSPIPAMSMVSCRRRPLPVADRRGLPELLRLVLRPAAGQPADLGRADRRAGVGRLVQLQLHHRLGLQRAADADPGRALLHRGAPRAPRPSPSPRTIPRWPSSPTSGSTPSRAPTPRWAWPSVT